MSDDIPPTRWRRAAGISNCLAGVVLIGFSIFATIRMVSEFLSFGKDHSNGLLAVLFFGTVGAALIWIGVGDLRGQRRPSWLVRLALYMCLLPVLILLSFVTLDAMRKQRAIESVQPVRNAIQQYEAKYPPLPAAPTLPTDSSDPNK